MRESRCMSLLPRTNLHSDSEQVWLGQFILEKNVLLTFIFVLPTNENDNEECFFLPARYEVH
jgi:hypothetical protein